MDLIVASSVPIPLGCFCWEHTDIFFKEKKIIYCIGTGGHEVSREGGHGYIVGDESLFICKLTCPLNWSVEMWQIA